MKGLYRFSCSLFAFILCLCNLGPKARISAHAEERIPEATIFYASACDGKWSCMCDAYAHTYFWENLDSGAISKSSSIEFLDNGTEGYRSCMALAGNGSGIYSVVATILNGDGGARFDRFDLCQIFPDQADQPIREVDLSQIVFSDEIGEYTLECTHALMNDQWLCLLFAQEDDGFGFLHQQHLLIALNLETGRQSSYEMADVYELFDISDSGLRFAFLSKDGGISLAEISLEDGKVKEYGVLLENVLPDCLCFSSEAHAIYYAMGSRLYGIQQLGDAPKQIANLPFVQAKYLHALEEDQLLAVSENDFGIVQLDWNASGIQAKLQISGGILLQFELTHPEILLEEAQGMMSDDIVTAILSRSETPDILTMNTASDQVYHALKNRGYLLPLENQFVINQVRQMYPAIQEAVSIDGNICALPLGLLYSDSLGCNSAILAEVGIDKQPETWPEMVDLLNRWPEISGQIPDVCLITNPCGWSLRRQILHHMLSSYELYRSNSQNFLGYDAPEFRALMDLYDQIDFDAIEAVEQTHDLSSALLVDGFDWMPGSASEEGVYPLSLSIADGIPAYLSANMYVLAVNPNSRNGDICQEYLAFAAQNMSAEDRLMLTPQFNEPQRTDNYEEALLETQNKIQELEAALSKSSSNFEPDLQLELESAKSALNAMENSWAISSKDIETYRSFADRIRIKNPIAINEEDQAVLDGIRNRFESGEMEAEVFIQEMDRRIRMNASEE